MKQRNRPTSAAGEETHEQQATAVPRNIDAYLFLTFGRAARMLNAQEVFFDRKLHSGRFQIGKDRYFVMPNREQNETVTMFKNGRFFAGVASADDIVQKIRETLS